MKDRLENFTYLIKIYSSFYREYKIQDKQGNPLKGQKTAGVKYKSCLINASVLVASATDL